MEETQETQVRSLGQEDPLEEDLATTPGFLNGESRGQRSLAGYSPWGCKESDTTEHNNNNWVTLLSELRILKLPSFLHSFIQQIFIDHLLHARGLPGGSDGKESACSAEYIP